MHLWYKGQEINVFLGIYILLASNTFHFQPRCRCKPTVRRPFRFCFCLERGEMREISSLRWNELLFLILFMWGNSGVRSTGRHSPAASISAWLHPSFLTVSNHTASELMPLNLDYWIELQGDTNKCINWSKVSVSCVACEDVSLSVVKYGRERFYSTYLANQMDISF